MIVDCYTSRVEEVSTISRKGNVITSPVEMSVVTVAISRALSKEQKKSKRCAVDILPTYLVFQDVNKIYPDLLEMVDEFRTAGYTAIFSLNPYNIKDEGAISTLQELFDGVIYLERTASVEGMMSDEIVLRIEKMAGEATWKRIVKIRRSSLSRTPSPFAPSTSFSSTSEDAHSVEV